MKSTFYLMWVVRKLDYQVQMNDYLLLLIQVGVDYALMLVYTMKCDLIARKIDSLAMKRKVYKEIYSW